MTRQVHGPVKEAIFDVFRIGLVIMGLSPLAVGWQLRRNGDLGIHLGINIALMLLGFYAGIYHLLAALHAIIVIFSYKE